MKQLIYVIQSTVQGESFEDWAAIPVWSLSLTVLYTTKGNEQR